MIGPDQMVGRSLGRRIRAVGSVGGVFSKKALCSQASIHLIGADVMKKRQSVLAGFDQLQQVESTYDIGLDKGVGPDNGAVHMRLCGKVTYGIDGIRIENARHMCRIANIRFYKHITFREVLCNVRYVFRVARIGEQVHIDDRSTEIGLFQNISDKIASNESTTACDQHILHGFTCCSISALSTVPYRATN